MADRFGGEDDRTISRPRPMSVLRPGTILGHTYVIESLIARGSIGEVYKAKHVELGTSHAINLLLPALANDPKLVELLVEEARKLARVHHDAIVNYEGLFRDEQGLRYLVMEFVDGESLATILANRRLEPADVLRLRDRLARGLAVAHNQGIVHRGIAPKYIIVPGRDINRAKLINFDIAHADEHGEWTLTGGSGTARQPFAAPEQLGLFGSRIDVRTDIYRLGLVLAAAALGFGKSLDMGATPAAAIAARQRSPDLSAIPAALRPAIAPMLSPRPEDRPASMLALLDTGAGSASLPESAGEKWQGAKALRPLFLIGGGIAAVVAGVAIVFRLMTPQISEPELRAKLATAVSGYQCADAKYAIGPDRSVQLSGHVSTPADLERLRSTVSGIRGAGPVEFGVAVMGWPHCEVASVLAPLLGRKAPGEPTLALDAAGGETHVGDRMTLDVRMPDLDGYVTVDYFSNDGQVLHLFPNHRDLLNIRPAYNRFFLFKPPLRSCWAFSGSAGQQLIAMVVSPKPLFAEQHVELEDARHYLPRLTEALGKVPQGAGAAALLFVDLHAARSLSNLDAACPSG